MAQGPGLRAHAHGSGHGIQGTGLRLKARGSGLMTESLRLRAQGSGSGLELGDMDEPVQAVFLIRVFIAERG